jgi:F-type H+-transporting ATPase subunit a
MTRSVVLLSVVLALFAAASEETPEHASKHPVPGPAGLAKEVVQKHEEPPQDTAGYILHHVLDSEELGFQVPLVDRELVYRFPVWRIPLKEGACPKDVRERASLGAGCLDLSLTKMSAMLFLGTVVLVLVFLLAARDQRGRLVPKGGLANFLEMMVVFVRNEIAIPNIGKEEGPKYVPYLLSVFFFVLVLNLLGLFPWMSSATGNIAVTVALAAFTFVLTQIASIRAAGFVGYLKHLTGGVPWFLWPIMIPVEILSLFTKPFALTLRLFANMLAGHIVLFCLIGLIFFIGHIAVAAMAVPLGMFIYFLELFVAFLQAYIFAMLSALYIGMGVAMGAHAEHGEEGTPPSAQH